MSEKVPLKGSICDVSFGYNSKMEGYTTLMSDIPKLSAHCRQGKEYDNMSGQKQCHGCLTVTLVFMIIGNSTTALMIEKLLKEEEHVN